MSDWREEIRARLEAPQHEKDISRLLAALDIAVEYLRSIGDLYDYEVDQAQVMAKNCLKDIDEVSDE